MVSRRAGRAPMLLANGPYDRGGEFFDYMGIWMMEVEARDDIWSPVEDDAGNPVMRPFESVAAQYLDRVGRNFAKETFHPDEVLAQSFVLIMQQPSLDLLGRLRSVLARSGGVAETPG